MNSSQIRRPKVFPAAAVIFCALSLGAMTVLAQSGRRAPKSGPQPTPTPEASPTPKPAEKEKLHLVIGIDSNQAFGRLPLYFYDSVLQSCAKRLGGPSSIKLEVQQNMNRGEAVKRAKAETETDVVLLQLRSDSVTYNNGNADYSQVYIEYFVFAPTTAKLITSGNVYQQNYRAKGIPIPGPSSQTNAVYAEQRLKQAAQEAADRILSALHVGSPSDLPQKPYQPLE